MSRGHYGNGTSVGTSRGQYGSGTGYGDVQMGADRVREPLSWWQLWVGAGVWIGAFSLMRLAVAATSAADARWAREEDRGWQKWLKSSAEERRRWPQERVEWNAWEYQAQDIDDEALKLARRAAKKK